MRWTLEEDQILINSYKEKKSLKLALTKLPHRSKDSIRGKVQELNIGNKQIPTTKNELFFSNQTPNSCWAAGLLATDGCIIKSKDTGLPHAVYLGLCTKDIELLNKFKEVTQYNGKIYSYSAEKTIINHNNKKYTKVLSNSSIRIAYAKDWVKDLMKKWNIIPNKTLIYNPPQIDDLHLRMAFISGVIDGDGDICLIKDDHHKFGYSLKIGFGGTKDLLDYIKNTFDFLTPSNTKRTVNKDTYANMYRYIISGTRAYVISKLFLCLNVPRLERKWDNARHFIEKVESSDLTKQMKNQLNSNIHQNSQEFLSIYGKSLKTF